jgi:PleD family two-component response regulator
MPRFPKRSVGLSGASTAAVGKVQAKKIVMEGGMGMANEADRGAAASILLVEDDPLGQKVGKAMLTHFGCQVDVAGNGREAVDALSRRDPGAGKR